MKTRVFIGSSSEALEEAKKIKEELSNHFDVTLWIDEKAFEINESIFDSLVKGAGIYDFGVFLATPDDRGFMRREWKKFGRDNVLFEYGLFLGSLGKNNTVLIWEKDTNLPSDLIGVDRPYYSRKSNESDHSSFNTAITRTIKFIKTNEVLSRHRFFPSLVLGLNYYNNFLKTISKHLHTNNQIDDLRYSSYQINLLKPSHLSVNMKDEFEKFCFDKKLKSTKIDIGRGYPVHYEIENDILVVYDLHQGLIGLGDTIEKYLKRDALQKTEAHRLLEESELNKFFNNVKHLCDEDPYLKSNYQIIEL